MNAELQKVVTVGKEYAVFSGEFFPVPTHRIAQGRIFYFMEGELKQKDTVIKFTLIPMEEPNANYVYFRKLELN